MPWGSIRSLLACLLGRNDPGNVIQGDIILVNERRIEGTSVWQVRASSKVGYH